MSNSIVEPSPAQLRRRKELRENYTRMMFAEDTRGRLLRASAVAVSRYGTRACTVQHILDQAGLSRRTFYKTFSSLEDALHALYEVAVQVLRQTMDNAVLHARTPLGKVIAAFDTWLQMQIIGGPLITALQREAMHTDSPLAVHRDGFIRSVKELMEQELRPIATQPVDDDLLLSIIFAIEGLVGWTGRRDRFDDEDRMRTRQILVALLTRAFGLGEAETIHSSPS